MRPKRLARRCRKNDRPRIASAIRSSADLLSPEEVAAVRSDDKDRVMAVVNKLDPEKRVDGRRRCLLPKSQAYFPEYRREAEAADARRGWWPAKTLKEARMYRAVYSNRQLEEVLVDYWFNHFNVDSTKNVGDDAESGACADREL